MKCKSCSYKNSDVSKYCAKCGKPLDAKNQFVHQDLVDAITSHLEFIGYEIGAPEELTGGSVRILVKSNTRSNIIFTFSERGLVALVSFYSLDKQKVVGKWREVLEVINNMNLSGLVCSYSISESKDSLVCSSWYPGEYSKKIFSEFIEMYESDIKARMGSSGIVDFA